MQKAFNLLSAKMSSIKISSISFEFSEAIDIKEYRKKTVTKVTMRKYDVARYLAMPKEERKYE